MPFAGGESQDGAGGVTTAAAAQCVDRRSGAWSSGAAVRRGRWGGGGSSDDVDPATAPLVGLGGLWMGFVGPSRFLFLFSFLLTEVNTHLPNTHLP